MGIIDLELTFSFSFPPALSLLPLTSLINISFLTLEFPNTSLPVEYVDKTSLPVPIFFNHAALNNIAA